MEDIGNLLFVKSDYKNSMVNIKNQLEELSDFLYSSSNKIKSYYIVVSKQIDTPSLNIILKRLNMYAIVFYKLAEMLKDVAYKMVRCNRNVVLSMNENETLSSSELEEIQKNMENANAYYQRLCSMKPDHENNIIELMKNKTFALEKYIYLKMKYKKYKELLISTFGTDHNGLFDLDSVDSLINKLNSEINYQGTLFE